MEYPEEYPKYETGARSKACYEREIAELSKKLSNIKKLTMVDIGQSKAPSKQEYKDAMLAIQREIER